MEIKVEKGRLIIYEKFYGFDEYDEKYNALEKYIINVDIKELAKLLKPYIDSIDNCECVKK